MSNNRTEEQTQSSVKRQKKALYIVIPIIATLILVISILVPSLFYVGGESYKLQIQYLINEGYIDNDFTDKDLAKACHYFYNDFDKDLTDFCFWYL